MPNALQSITLIPMENKSSQIGPIRMSEAEEKLIREAAEKKEKKPGTFIREASVKEARRVTKKDGV